MKREYNISNGYVDWLKSIGCVLYLPLNNGDFKDYISGNTLQLTGSVTMTWDDTMNAYLITTPSTSPTTIATLDSLVPSSDWSANIVSGCAIVRRGNTNYQNKGAEIFCVGSANNCLYPSLMVNGTSGNMSNWDNNFHDVGMVFSGSGRKWYQDGSVYRTDTYGGRAPSSWGTNKNWFISTSASGNTSTKFYVKGIMLFNRELSVSDYRTINGY